MEQRKTKFGGGGDWFFILLLKKMAGGEGEHEKRNKKSLEMVVFASIMPLFHPSFLPQY
jgi:hypothetical protein